MSINVAGMGLLGDHVLLDHLDVGRLRGIENGRRGVIPQVEYFGSDALIVRLVLLSIAGTILPIIVMVIQLLRLLSSIDNLTHLSDVMDILDDAMLLHVLHEVLLLLPISNATRGLGDCSVLYLQAAT